MAKKIEPLDANDLARMITQGLKAQAARPNLHAYKPHAKQLIFHSSIKKKKLYIGGNRSGKTTGGVVEDLYWLRGSHPFRPIPEGPIRGRVVGVDFVNGISKIILPEFGRWCPPSLLKNGSWEDSYSKEFRTLTLANGSFVEFMSYDQDTDKFAGTSRHFVHYDEEPPQHVYNECNARLVDTNGDFWISMTPVDGMTWIYDTLYKQGVEDPNGPIQVIEVDMLENPYINEEAAENFLSSLSKDERVAREHGKFVQLGGRVFKGFSKDIHTIEPITPDKDWQWYMSLDHGFNNPTAVLWHAVSPQNEIITFAEHYQSEMVIDEHAAKIHSVNSSFDREPDVNVGDPAIAQRQATTGVSIQGEYADRGIFLSLGNNDVNIGIARMAQYLRINPATGRPFWQISTDCPNLINEMLRLRWQTFSSRKAQFENNKQEKIHKKDDHACDSARYFFSCLPDLTPVEFGTAKPEETAAFPAAVGRNPYKPQVDRQLDKLLLSMHSSGTTKWRTTESTDLSGLEYE